jgi:abequosyltransferase
MLPTIAKPTMVKLSICITTYNRAAFIGATIESILDQVTSNCELVVLDGASTDNTEDVVLRYKQRFGGLRYVRQNANNGFDRDCDRVVELANGEYCWLMTDDDLLKPGAVAKVLKALRRDLSLVIVNAEIMDFRMSKVLQQRWIHFDVDRRYEPDDMDRLLVELGEGRKYVGSVVIKRAIWLARDRERYYGSSFVFLGVIFQEPLPGDALIIAEPLVSYRMGNAHTFSQRMFETYLVKFPALIGSLAPSEAAKTEVCNQETWRDFRDLLLWRARGLYSLHEYRQWIRPTQSSVRDIVIPSIVARMPGALANAMLVLYCIVIRRPFRGLWEPEFLLQMLRESRFHCRNWRFFKREL